MIRSVHLVLIIFLLTGEFLYLYSDAQTANMGTHWTVIPSLEISDDNTHVLHGEHVPSQLTTQQSHTLRQNGAGAGSSVAQAAAGVASSVADAIAAALPRWPSIHATVHGKDAISPNATAKMDAISEQSSEPSSSDGEMLLSFEESGSDSVTEAPAVEDSAAEDMLPSAQTPAHVEEKKREKEKERAEKKKDRRDKEKKGNAKGQPSRKERPNAASKVPLPVVKTTEKRENYLTQLHAQHGKENGIATHEGKSKGMVTIIMMGYFVDRLDNYRRVLSKYRSMCNLVDKLILVWNNQNAKSPRVPDPRPGTDCMIPVIVLLSKKNSLNNRFLVSHLVKTEAVFTVDDDFLFSESLLRCLLRHWERDKDRIVGVHPRLVESSGAYNTHYVNGYNLILTGSALFHVRFLDLYAKNLEVQAKVDSIMSGEDILFNAVSQNVTRKPPLFVVPRKNFRFKEFKKSSNLGLHSRYTWEQWLRERSNIAAWALEHFPKDVFRMETKKGLCHRSTPHPKH